MISTVDPPTVEFPRDVETLQKMVQQLLADNAQLARQLAWFKRHVFGRRSEKLDPKQLALFAELAQRVREADQVQESQDSVASSGNGGSRKGLHGRSALPKHLPRERIEYHPEESQRTCPTCNTAMNVIGEEITEELDYVPASFVVREHVRVKYACKQCQEGVAIAELPPRPIDKGRPGPGLLAQVLTSKYCDHLPLHRQEQIYQRHGVDIARSTMCDWVRDAATLLNPIVQYMKKQILQSKKIHADETPVPVQDPGRTQTRKGYLWAYVGHNDQAVFDYTPTRCRDGPINFLGDYARYVQADAYSGYDEYFKISGAMEVGCWAHARRYFYEARGTSPHRAQEMLALIGRLYDVERQATERELNATERQLLRQERSAPLLEQIKALLDKWSVEVLPKSPLGEAVQYALRQWTALTRYVTDGDLNIDNNTAERALRMVAIGRKNWIFCGSDAGGQRAAVIYSLVATCKLCKIDPFAYLRDVLDRVSTHPASDIAALTPQGWTAARVAQAGQAA